MVCDEDARLSYCSGGVVWWDAGVLGGDTDWAKMGVSGLCRCYNRLADFAL